MQNLTKPRNEPLFFLFEDKNLNQIKTNALMSRKHHAFWMAKWKLCGKDDVSFQRYLGEILEQLAEAAPKF